MRIACSKSFTQPPCVATQNNKSEAEVEQILQRLIEETGIDCNEGQRAADGTLQLNLSQDLKLHTLLLKAEKHGLNVRYTKQTVIDIC